MIPAAQKEQMLAAKAGDRQAEEQLLRENTGLIWSIVRRYSHRAAEPEDLYQLGCLGFLKAVRGFDFSYGTHFSTYAVPKIAGEIRRFLRDDGMVKVSRSLKERAGTVSQARDRLQSRLGREPSLSQLSEETGLRPEDIASADLAVASVASLQGESRQTGQPLETLLGCDGPEERLLESLSLEKAMEHLPAREKKILLLRYFRGYTQERTARLLGLSQVQISRLERKSLAFLREELSR